MSEMPRLPWWKKAVFAAAPVLLVLLVAEIALRLWAPPWTVFENRVPLVYEAHEGWGYRYRPGSSGVLRRYREIEQEIRIGPHGWRGAAPGTPKPEDVFRVVLVGDSHVAGLEVPEEAMLGAQLEAALARAWPDRQVEVASLGLDGSGTDVQRDFLLEEGLALEPDLVLVAVFRNDFRDIGRPLVYREVYEDHVLLWQTPAEREALRNGVAEQRHDPLRALARVSYLARAVRFVVAGEVPSNFVKAKTWFEERETWEPLPERVAAVVAALESMRAATEAGGGRFAVVALPASWMLKPDCTPDDGSYAARLLREPLEKAGVPLLDLWGPVVLEPGEPSELFWRTDSHPNPHGYRVMAEAAARWIAQGGLEEARNAGAEGPLYANLRSSPYHRRLHRIPPFRSRWRAGLPGRDDRPIAGRPIAGRPIAGRPHRESR